MKNIRFSSNEGLEVPGKGWRVKVVGQQTRLGSLVNGNFEMGPEISARLTSARGEMRVIRKLLAPRKALQTQPKHTFAEAFSGLIAAPGPNSQSKVSK